MSLIAYYDNASGGMHFSIGLDGRAITEIGYSLSEGKQNLLISAEPVCAYNK
jgi:hypothetical protein